MYEIPAMEDLIIQGFASPFFELLFNESRKFLISQFKNYQNSDEAYSKLEVAAMDGKKLLNEVNFQFRDIFPYKTNLVIESAIGIFVIARCVRIFNIQFLRQSCMLHEKI